MSLVEIMVVITIMALVMGAVAVAVFPMKKKADCTNTWTELKQIQGAVTAAGGDCPASLQDIRQYLTKDPKDEWDKPFLFKCPSEHGDSIDVWSSGPDKQEGTPDDVKSWLSSKEQCK